MFTEIFRQKKEFLLLLALIAAFVIGYYGTFWGMIKTWMKNEDYTYAFAIPPVAGYIIWQRRHLIAQTRIETDWIGGVFFAIFLAFSLYGVLGSSPSAVRPAIPLVILSLILFCYGRQMLKVLAFPVALLVFMIPLPTLVQNQIGFPLQLLSTQLGEYILRLTGVTVFVEGNIIDLGVTQLQVVEACSGLRYMLPLLALGVVFSHFFEHVRWKQIVLTLSTIPTAIICNGLRIGITGFLAQNYNLRIAEGFFHGFSGWLIFVFALCVLFAIYATLRLLFPSSSEENEGPVSPNDRLPASHSTRHGMAVIVSAVLLIFVGLLSYATAALPPVRINNGFTQFPLKINGWHGRVENMDSKIIQLSGAEDAFNGIYRFSAENIVSLYIGYRASPFNESENFFHSPNICLPSLGWQTLTMSAHEISEVPGFDRIVVRKMLIEKMGYRQLVYYWFQTKSRVSSNVNVNRLHLTLHALRRDNTHDLFIRPITPLMPGETVESASVRLDQFVRVMMDALLKFLSAKQGVSNK